MSDPLIHPDPFTLRVCVGGTGDGKRYKTVAALRGVPEVEGHHTSAIVVPLALGQLATFYTGESYKIKGVGWTVQSADFWIIAGNPMAEHQVLGHCYTNRDDDEEPGPYEPSTFYGYHIAGYFDILAHGDGRTRALRLLKWWLEWEPSLPRRREMAEHLGRMIGIRGQKEPGAMFRPGEFDIELEEGPAFKPAEWDIEI